MKTKKETKKMLWGDEGEWYSLIKNAPNTILILDRKGKILFINHTVPGATRKSVIGTSHYKYIPREYQDHVKKTIDRVFRTGNPCKYVTLGPGPDGSMLWYEAMVGPIKTNGKVTAVSVFAVDITKRKNAEDKLHDLAKFPVENINPVYRISRGGVLLYLNTAAKKLSLTAKTKVGDKVPKKWSVLIKQIYDSKERHVTELELSEGVYEFEQIPILGKNYVNIYAKNITEKKVAKTKLAKQIKETAVLDGVLSSSSQPFALGSVNGRLLKVNSAFCELVGYTEKELLNKPEIWTKKLTPKKWRAAENERLTKFMKTKKDVRFEKEYITKKGKIVPVEILVTPKLDAKGKLERIYAFVTDITERKNVLEELQASENRLASLFDNTNDAIFIAKIPSMRFVKCNKKALEMIGYSKKKLLSMTITDITPKASVPRTMKSVAEFLITRTGIVETQLVGKNNNPFDVEGSVSLVKINGTEYMQGIFRDITERKKAEKEIHQFDSAAVDRELRMVEMKKEVNSLLKELGRKPKYRRVKA